MSMKVLVFGNKEYKPDGTVYPLVKKLKRDFPEVEFLDVSLNTDLPLSGDKVTYILDAVEGINEPTVIKNADLDRLTGISSVSVHDFDLGFQLRYLRKIKKLGEVVIIGLPLNKKTNYLRIQSIFRKLVAQDIQGS